MTDRVHNNPPVTLELDRELVEFLVENCDSNLHLSIQLLGTFPNRTPTAKNRERGEKIVAMIEKFRKIKRIAEEGLKS